MATEAAAAARSSQRSAPSTSPRSSRVIATPPAARNSIARSPWSRAARQASSVRDDLGSGIHVDPEEHLEVEAIPFALGDELRQAARHPPDLLEMPRRRREV